MIKKTLTFSLKLVMVSILLMGTNLLAEGKISRASSWIITRITYNISVQELAERYYGDREDYKLILDANKNKVRGYIIPKNTKIIIPVTSKFRDQPEQLGWN